MPNVEGQGPARIDRIAVSGTVAAAFITDPEDRVLLVKPASRDEWGFTGGWVDRGESPHLARPRAGEIEAFGFFAPEQAIARCGEFNRGRLGLALEARRTGRTAYQPFA